MKSMFTALAISIGALLGGCRSHDAGGILSMPSLGSRPNAFEPEFSGGCYTELDSEVAFWFSSAPIEELIAAVESPGSKAAVRNGVFLHAQLVWKPEPGRTPLAATATNVVTRMIVVSDGEVGLYGGAAFARPKGEIGDGRLELDLKGGTLTLLARTEGFHDLLSPVGLEGRLAAPRAPEEAARWRRVLSQFATNSFGRSMWVDGRSSGWADTVQASTSSSFDSIAAATPTRSR